MPPGVAPYTLGTTDHGDKPSAPDLETALRCPACRSTLQRGSDHLTCTGCDRRYAAGNGWIDFLVDEPADIQHDYAWEPAHDPRITPLTRVRWAILADAHVDAMLTSGPRPFVVSVGGGGDSWLAPRLDQRVGAYVVVDPSEHQLRTARLPRGAATLRLRAAAERVPLEDRCADVVELHSVLDHVTDADQCMGEAARLLRPGGLVTISLGNDASWYRRLAGRLGVHSDDEHAHAQHFDVPAVRRLLTDAGFAVETTTTMAYLRAPARLERLLSSAVGARRHRHLIERSDRVGRRIVGRDRGGMLLVVGRQPG